MRTVTRLLAIAVLSTACSSPPAPADEGPDAQVCVDPAATMLTGQTFGTPADFDRSACQPGAMSGFDANGFWFMESEDQGKFSAGPVRMKSSCEGGVEVSVSGIASATPMPEVLHTADDLFFRRERAYGEWTLIEAYNLCATDQEGRAMGRAIRCWVSPEGRENCSDRAILLGEFGRIPGEDEASGIELVSEFNGPAGAPWPDAFTANVAVHGDTAFLARGRDAVRIVDVSDLSSPVEIASIAAESDNYNDLAVVPTADKVYLLVASSVFGIMVLDVTEPATPREVLRFDIERDSGVHRLWVDHVVRDVADGGDIYRAYLASGNGTVIGVWDVTDPAAPTELGTYRTGDEAWGVHAVFARGNDVYINATAGGLLALRLNPDVTPGSSVATQIGRYVGPDNVFSHASMPATTSSGQRVVLHAEEGFDSPLQILDDDSESGTYMQILGEFSLRKQVSMHNFHVIGDKGYLAHYQDGVRIVDFSDPTDVQQLAYFNTWDPATAPGGLLEGAVDLEVRGDLIFLAETPRGLVILREK